MKKISAYFKPVRDGQNHDKPTSASTSSPLDMDNEPLTSIATNNTSVSSNNPNKRLRLEPNQPHSYRGSSQFPITKSRKFLPKWYESFPWLEYNDERDVVFCHPCAQVKQQGCVQVSKSQDEFTDKGFSNWKKAIDSFKKHESSGGHRLSIYEFSSLSEGGNVAVQLQTQKEEEMSTASECLLKIISCVRFLTRQGLPLRGHDNDNSNLTQLLLLPAEDSSDFAKWMKRKTKWSSVEMQHEIAREMSHQVLREIIAKIKKHGYYGIMVDETTDTSTMEQMTICFRSVNEKLEVEESFVGVYQMDTCDSASIYGVIRDVLTRFDLSIHNCRSQTYDGASTFQGTANGVAARISRDEPRAVPNHCHMHCVNLAVQDAISCVPMFRDFLFLVQELGTFFRTSPKRTAIMQNIAEATDCPQSKIRPLCPTRFMVRYRALDALKKQLNVIMEVFNTIEESADVKVAAQVGGFRQRVSTFDFHLTLLVSHRLFEITDRLSKALQKEPISVGAGVELVRSAIAELKATRDDSYFNRVFEEAVNMSPKEPHLPRQPRAPRRLQQADVHRFETPEAYYRQSVFMMIDGLIKRLHDRILDKMSPVITAIEHLVQAGWKGEEIPEDDLHTVVEYYGEDLSKERLKAQIMSLENVPLPDDKERDETSMTDITSLLGKSSVQHMIPEVMKLLTLYVICPSTTASAERSFSQLRRLKTYLRSTMSQELLNYYMVLAMYPEKLDGINLRHVANQFIAKNDLRRNTFKPFKLQ